MDDCFMAPTPLFPMSGPGRQLLLEYGRAGDRSRCEPVVRSIAANNGNCCVSRRAGCDGAFWHACAGVQNQGKARRNASPAVFAGNALNRKAAKPNEYSVMPPNNKAVLRTANDNIMVSILQFDRSWRQVMGIGQRGMNPRA